MTENPWQNVEGAIPPDWLQGRGTGNSGQRLLIITDEGVKAVEPGDWITCDGDAVFITKRRDDLKAFRWGPGAGDWAWLDEHQIDRFWRALADDVPMREIVAAEAPQCLAFYDRERAYRERLLGRPDDFSSAHAAAKEKYGMTV